MDECPEMLNTEDDVRLAAWEIACYEYPEEDQQAIRAAFVEGVVWFWATTLPPPSVPAPGDPSTAQETSIKKETTHG